MIEISAVEILEEDPKFFHKAIISKERNSNRARRSMTRTLSKIVLRKADYTAPNPAERITPEMGLDRLAELFTGSVYEKIKKDASLDDIDPKAAHGNMFMAEITLGRDKPALCDCYEAFFKLVLQSEYMPEIDNANRAAYEKAAKALERAEAELEDMEDELDGMRANLKRKKAFGSKSKNTSGLENQIRLAAESTGSKRSSVEMLAANATAASEKIKSDSEQGKAFYNHLLLEVAASAENAGLDELASAAREMVDGKAALIESLDEGLNEIFDELITQKPICNLEGPMYRPRIWPRWVTVGGPVAAVAAIGIIAALVLGGKSQAMKDYEMYKKGEMSMKELEAKYPPKSDGYREIIRRFAKEETAIRDIQFADTPEDLNRILGGRYARGQPPSRIEPTSTMSSGMRRDGTRWKPKIDPEEAARRKKLAAERKRNNLLKLAVTEGKGVEVYRYDGDIEFNINLGNWWLGVDHTKNEAPERLIMYCQKEKSTVGSPATVLEMIVDEEKKLVTPIIPKSMEEGRYLLVLDLEKSHGREAKDNYMMTVKRQNGQTYMGVVSIGRQVLPFKLPPPDAAKTAWRMPSKKAEVPRVTLNDRKDMGGTVEFFYLDKESGDEAWKHINHKGERKEGGILDVNPIFPPGTPAGEYVVKSRTEYENGTSEEDFFKAEVDENGRASLVDRIFPEAELPKPHPIEEIYKAFTFGEPKLEYRQGNSGPWNPLTVDNDPVKGKIPMSFPGNADWDITIRATTPMPKEEKLYRASVKGGEIVRVSEMHTSSPAVNHP